MPKEILIRFLVTKHETKREKKFRAYIFLKSGCKLSWQGYSEICQQIRKKTNQTLRTCQQQTEDLAGHKRRTKKNVLKKCFEKIVCNDLETSLQLSEEMETNYTSKFHRLDKKVIMTDGPRTIC